MPRLKAIQKRLLEIKELLNTDDCNVEALRKETDELIEERTLILENEEKRQALLNDIATGAMGSVISTFSPEIPVEQRVDAEVYKRAFLKNLLQIPLTEEENRAFVHTTENTDAVIPVELQNKIYSNMEEKHPLLADVQVLRTGTVISIVKHTTIVAGDAKEVAEGVANDDEQNTFVTVSLSGKDFSKHVDISYRLGKMAIPAFEEYIVTEIADRIGAAMAKDIVAQIKKDLAVANKFAAATPAKLALADFLKGFGALKGVGNVNVYANNASFYTQIANMESAEGKLSFIPNYQEQIAGQVLGKAIKQEDALADGEILILDPNQFVYNIVQDIMIERDKNIKTHVHTIAGFAIAEGTMTNDKAGAVISVTVGG